MDNRVAELEQALSDASKSRGDLYVAFFRSVEKRYGREVARDVLKDAVYQWGRTLGGALKGLPIPDLRTAFATQPDGGKQFKPRIDRLDSEAFDVQFEGCPLKDRWEENEMSDEDIAMFCEIAAAADYGTLEAGGFSISIDTWTPGASGCCMLRIRPGTSDDAAAK